MYFFIFCTWADSCAVEATFQLAENGRPSETASPMGSVLDELGLAPCDDGQLIIRRQFAASGTGNTVSVALSEVALPTTLLTTARTCVPD